MTEREPPYVPEAEVLDGAAVLDELREEIARYVAMPSPEALDAVTLWVAATHAQPGWDHATRLAVKSPIKRCGKSRLLEIVGATSHRAILTSNVSTAALVRSIDESNPPTLVLDEADAVFARRRGEASERAEDLRGIINSGHGRGFPYIRWDAARRTSEECPTFAMVALAAIGDLPDTIEDRAVVVHMRRRAPGEAVAPFRRRRALPSLYALRDRLAQWAADHAPALEQAEPELPVEDRAADVWESVIAVADEAGGDWPMRVRRACTVLTEAADDPDDGTLAERLLDDMRVVLGSYPAMHTSAILDALHAIEDGPWSDWFGKPLSGHALGRLLKPYGIKSKQMKLGGVSKKGYMTVDFTDAWTRYRRTNETKRNPETSGADDGESVEGKGVSDTQGSFAFETSKRNQSETPETRYTARGNGLEEAKVSEVSEGSHDRLDDDIEAHPNGVSPDDSPLVAAAIEFGATPTGEYCADFDCGRRTSLHSDRDRRPFCPYHLDAERQGDSPW